MTGRSSVAGSLVALGVVVAACGSSAGDGGGSAAQSNADVCAQALGVVVVSEVGDDAARREEAAKDAASRLSRLASQTRDRSLSQALSAAAGSAAEAGRERLSGDALKTWATREEQRFAALRRACS